MFRLVLILGLLWSTIGYTKSLKEEFIERVEGCLQVTDSPDIPIKLIIGTAALESGWGTSRFAKEGNNLFGIRTFDSDTPQMKPLDNPNANFGVKVYADYCDSVYDYVNTIETNPSYVQFRVLRDKGYSLNVLVDSLGNYAQNPSYTIILSKVIRGI